jgi:hypothetical protein
MVSAFLILRPLHRDLEPQPASLRFRVSVHDSYMKTRLCDSGCGPVAPKFFESVFFSYFPGRCNCHGAWSGALAIIIQRQDAKLVSQTHGSMTGRPAAQGRPEGFYS